VHEHHARRESVAGWPGASQGAGQAGQRNGQERRGHRTTGRVGGRVRMHSNTGRVSTMAGGCAAYMAGTANRAIGRTAGRAAQRIARRKEAMSSWCVCAEAVAAVSAAATLRVGVDPYDSDSDRSWTICPSALFAGG
jgi:hypothetical protein